jgi:nitrite reductase/ring-hydroxylating ferredoxin subunit
MNWIKIFNSKIQAEEKLREINPVLIIYKNKRLCLTLFQSSFYATSDTCPHQSESLSKGAINRFGEIICPLHNYRYNLKFGGECESRTADLKTYPIKIDDTGFYIGLKE